MKKSLKLILLGVFILLLIWPIYYFVNKSNNDDMTYSLEEPEFRTIANYVICSGTILPEEEVEIKSRVSGVLEKVFFKTGDKVYKGDIIAQVKIVPDVGQLAAADSKVKSARINFANQKVIYSRNKVLMEKEIISKSEFEIIETNYLNSKEELSRASNDYSIIQSGNHSNMQSNTSIVATIEGIITLLPTKIGSSIIQSNNFNEGTTIAKIAKIDRMIFDGNVMEDEVDNLSIGMPIAISTALNEKNIVGKLTEISTSGKDADGIIMFNIKSVFNSAGIQKTGFSANAKILTKERKNVLCIKEEWVSFSNDSGFVYIKNKDNSFLKRFINLGISDGVYSEVLKGLSKNEIIKVDAK